MQKTSKSQKIEYKKQITITMENQVKKLEEEKQEQIEEEEKQEMSSEEEDENPKVEKTPENIVSSDIQISLNHQTDGDKTATFFKEESLSDGGNMLVPIQGSELDDDLLDE